MRNFYIQPILSGFLFYLFLAFSGFLETTNGQSFSQNDLDFNGKGKISNGTSIMFGPDGRLYVAEYSGEVKILTVERAEAGDYKVLEMEVLTDLQDIQNYNDNGTTHSSKYRETTGLTVAGTASNPVIYVTSSDFRIGGGGGGGNGDIGLDTNSGIITRFSWNGATWDVVDLVRGLPRSEENHATNGLEFVTVNGADYLIVAQGGHTNGGSPSVNFAYTAEYALSAAILSVNLTMLNSFPIKEDNGRKYIYDLPTLDDPSRPNVNGIIDPDTPGYDGLDVNDPFGGNDGLNQSIIVPDGPVQIFSPGYRNAYDVVVTESGAVYVTDNGSNGGWGGFPVNEGTGSVNNDYDPDEPGSSSPSGGEEINNKDHLSLVTLDIKNYSFGSFYGGHPNPTRANPSGAGLYTNPAITGNDGAVFRTQIYDPDGSTPGSTTNPDLGLPANWPPVNTPNLQEGDWRGPGIGNPDGPDDEVVTTWGTNTNAIDEYTASNFGGAMKGDLIAGVNTGTLRRVELNPDGTLDKLTSSFASGIGGDALGITCNGDEDIFPGTIWVVTLNGELKVLEPQDFIVCLAPGDAGYDAEADNDLDGYTNQDEVDNGTDPCNGGSQPNDFDKSGSGDLTSDLNDLDDDGDGILDENDSFQLGDPKGNGSDAFSLPVINELFSSNEELKGYMGLGMTGLMNNGDPNPNWLNWLDRRDDPDDPNPNDILGGAIGAMTMHMTSGTALGDSNSQEKGFQYGVQVSQATGEFTVTGNIVNFHGPLQLYGNSEAPAGELGFFIGDGTQSNYIKFVITPSGITAVQEINDVLSDPLHLEVPVEDRPDSGVIFYFSVVPVTGEVTLGFSFDNKERKPLGTITAQGQILNALQQADKDLAVGMIGTSNASGVEVEGTWDFLNVTTSKPSVAESLPDMERTIGSPTEDILLEDYFYDEEGAENLTYTVEENTDPSLGAVVSGSVLSLTFPMAPATSEVTVRATNSSSAFVEQTFRVIVREEFVSQVLFRVNSGGPAIPSIDGGIEWGADTKEENSPYLSQPAGNKTAGYEMTDFANGVDLSTTPTAIYGTERYNTKKNNPHMMYSFPVEEGTYEVRLYMGNSYDGTSETGERVFDVAIEDVVYDELDELDLSATFGHRVGGVIVQRVEVTDGSLDINFHHGSIENPVVNGIEVLGSSQEEHPIVLAEIPDQTSTEGDELDGSLAVSASGGDGNLSYSMTGQPAGVIIEPTNGQIGGSIETGAAQESPYTVTVTVDDGDGVSADAKSISFTWDVGSGTPYIAQQLPDLERTASAAEDHIDLNVYFDDDKGVEQLVYTVEVTEGSALLASITDGILSLSYPDAPELADVTVRATDGDNNHVEQTFSVNISEETSGGSIQVAQVEDQSSLVGEELDGSLEVSTSGGDGQLVFTMTGAPDGVVIDDETGVISGKIEQNAAVGSPYSVTVTVDDSDDQSDDVASTSFSWSVSGEELLAWGDKDENENYTARHECSFVQAGDKFYLMGGRENGKTIDVYDYHADTWNSLVDSAPFEFNHFQATEYQGLIWIIGAFKDNSYPTESPAEHIWIFDPSSEEWIQGAEIPSNRQRGSGGLVVFEDNFYLIGGNTAGHDGGAVAWFDQYDPATGIWTSLEDAPRARDHFHSVVMEGKLYAVGGRLSGGVGGTFSPLIPEVDIYDFSSGSWTTLPVEQNIPTPRAAASVVNFNNKLLVIGGEVDKEEVYGEPTSDALEITEEFDPSTGIWKRLADLNHERHGTQAIVSGSAVYTLAGSPNLGGGSQKNMEYFGQDNPAGAPNIASTLSVPDTAEMSGAADLEIEVEIANGNMGVYIKSAALEGPNADQFAIVSGALSNSLIKPNSSRKITVAYQGGTEKASAELVLRYGANQEVSTNIVTVYEGIQVAQIEDQVNLAGDHLEGSLAVSATGGEGDLVFGMSGGPEGVFIDSETGLIGGSIDANAAENSPYLVTIEVDDSDEVSSDRVSTSFTWIVNAGEPYVVLQLPDLQRKVGALDEEILLDNYFDDDQGSENLMYSVAEITDSSISTEISGGTLTLGYPMSPTVSDITIRAVDDYSNFVEQTFRVAVTEEEEVLVLYRVNSGGPAIASIDGEMDWSADTKEEYSQFLVEPGGNKAAGYEMTGFTNEVDLSTTPADIYDTERYNTSKYPAMAYSFPVSNGLHEIRLYVGNSFEGTASQGQRIFDVEIEGAIPSQLKDIDLSGTYGHQIGAVIKHTVNVTDGYIDVRFLHGAKENPVINGLEILQIGNQEENSGQLADNSKSQEEVKLEENRMATTARLYPNPTVYETFLEVSDSSVRPSKILFYDSDGRLVQILEAEKYVYGEGIYQLDVSSLPRGVYIVALEAENSPRTTLRLLLTD